MRPNRQLLGTLVRACGSMEGGRVSIWPCQGPLQSPVLANSLPWRAPLSIVLWQRAAPGTVLWPSPLRGGHWSVECDYFARGTLAHHQQSLGAFTSAPAKPRPDGQGVCVPRWSPPPRCPHHSGRPVVGQAARISTRHSLSSHTERNCGGTARSRLFRTTATAFTDFPCRRIGQET